MLQVERLTVSFRALKAVQDLSFEVREGELLAIIGPNGAGKTTLFNALTGMVRPAAGRMRFRGTDITGMESHRIAALGLARTFQKRSFFPRLTALENVVTALHGQPRAKVRGQAEELLEFMGLAEERDQVAEALPYGQQRRLGIAIALATRPKALLLDEPVAGMNPTETEQMVGLLGAVRGRVPTIVLVEHHMKVVMRLAERIIAINFGQKLAEGSPAEIRANPAVIEAYLGREEALHG